MLAAALVFCHLALLCHGFPIQSQLLSKVLKNYVTDVRPVDNYTDTINVKFSLVLRKLADFDRERGVATLLVWERMEWKDNLITWEPASAEGIDQLRIPQEKIWKPDIMLYQRLGVENSRDKNVLALVHSTGDVYWVSRSVVKVPCQRRHPEIWNCKMTFGSWVYDSSRVSLEDKNEGEGVDISDYDAQWRIQVIGNSAVRNRKTYSDKEYDDITYNLLLKGY